MRKKSHISLILAGASLLIGLSAWIGHIYFSSAPQHPSLLNSSSEDSFAAMVEKGDKGPALIGGSFHLTDHLGIDRTEIDYKGKFLIIYFGYTYCPDICPAALSNISEALTRLGPKADQIFPLFITIDPERDSASHLALYLQSFHPHFIGLTGTRDQIEHIKKVYRVYGVKADLDTAQSADYIMDHSSIVYVMDRQGRFVAHFNHSTEPQEIVHLMNKLLT